MGTVALAISQEVIAQLQILVCITPLSLKDIGLTNREISKCKIPQKTSK